MTQYQSTEECFNDLCDRFRNFEDRNQFANTFGIDQVTFAKWNNRGFTASGEKLVRIRAGLELTGYNVSEWRTLDRSLYTLVEAIAFDVMSISEIAKELEYANSKLLVHLLVKATAMTKDRHDKAIRLIDKIQKEVDEARLDAIDAISKLKLKRGSVAYLILEPDCEYPDEYWAVDEPPYPVISVQEKILMFDNLVKALLPLARFFDNSPTEDRKVLRKAVGYAEMSEVTELLRGLSSEKYRESR